MIPEKIDPMSITTIRENNVESIFDWFDQHKKLFYILGWCNLRNQQQIEELFYRSIIKAEKELSQLNRGTSFDRSIASIFFDTCQELSEGRSLQVSKEGESKQELFKTLDQLNEHEKEAVVLTYVKGISREEATNLLQVSAKEMKGLLFSGVQSLRKEWGDGSFFNGCKEYQPNYIDYIERTLERPKKIDFEMHLFHCENCREDLGTFQDVILNLTERFENFSVPSALMKNIQDRLSEQEKRKHQNNKKRKRMGLIFVSVFTTLIGLGVFTGYFTNLYYTWTEEDDQLRAFLQHGLGERLNLEAESNGVKIKIKSAIADDLQTLIFYEIEDSANNNQYVLDYYDGIYLENEHEIMDQDMYPRYYPPDLKLDENNKEKNVFHGKVSFPPLKKDDGTIKLKVSKLFTVIPDSTDGTSFGVYDNMEYETGEWNFEIPVTKMPSIEYALDEETEVEGIPVRFDKLIIAPTATILHSAYPIDLPKMHLNSLNLDNLKVNNKIVKADMFGNSFLYQSNHRISSQTYFDPLFEETPKEINVQFQSVNVTVEEQKTIELDVSKAYPQTFEYAGSTISIDKVEVGQPTNVVISSHDIENRAYEWIHFEFFDENERLVSSMARNSEGVLVDKNGIAYDMNEMPSVYKELEQPRYFFTVENLELYSDNAEENVIPKKLEIYEYHTTKYLDDIVKLSLE
ncbi:DUF4179 domain-containing protein [Bacillus niameyensis]|uniref:DUF4179 domain-containing protein n=1 Tax=Bacillus niameyensis TaxID=1522308 RepID=UPI0007826056|nr:DUF4179 domain-containing protein [Bacillus niameyensis]